MKKVFTFIMGVVATMASTTVWADTKTVTTNNELIAELTKVRTNEQYDTIYVKYADGGLSTKSQTLPNAGHIHLIGLNDEETGAKATMMFEFNLPKNTAADRLSLIFENLTVKDFNGALASSKYLFSAKDSLEHYIDSLIFRNCEITDFNRAIYRVENQIWKAGEFAGTRADCGEVSYFEMSDCSVHYGSMLNNSMSLFYGGHRFVEMVFRNNTFYDLPYLHSIVTLSYMDDDSGLIDIDFTFENNTVIARSSNTLFLFNAFVMPTSRFHINNNFFLHPNWSDECNNINCSADSLLNLPQKDLASIMYGYVEIKNNVVEGYKSPKMYLDEDGAGEWLSADTLLYKMADVEFSWADFLDAQNDLFGIWNGHKVYTAGVNGAPIGNINEYTDVRQEVASLEVKVEGSKSASVTISPEKDRYIVGDVVRLTANTKDDLNEFIGWSDGSTELSHDITITSDIVITATFKEQSYLAVWNLDDLTANNKKFAAPMPANYAVVDGAYLLNYATFDGTAYVDSLTDALQTRNNKVSTDVIRNCFIIRSTLEQLDELKKPDYLYMEIPAGVTASSINCYVGTDNYCSKTVNADYSTDGTNWVNFGKIEIAEVGKWHRLMADIPAEVVGQHIYVRIQGDAEGERIMNEEIADGLLEKTFEFIFVADIRIMGDGNTAIETIEADKAAVATDAAIYDIMGRRVLNTEAGRLYIQNGKKFIQK